MMKHIVYELTEQGLWVDDDGNEILIDSDGSFVDENGSWLLVCEDETN